MCVKESNGGMSKQDGTLIPGDHGTGRLWNLVVTDRGRSFRWHLVLHMFESFYASENIVRYTIRLIHESSLNFGGGSRRLVGLTRSCPHDQPREFWSSCH